MVGSHASNILGLFQKDPKYRTLVNIKDQALQGRINSLSGDYDRLRQQGYDSLGDWTRAFMADAPMAEGRTASELAVLDRIYGGGTENDLMGLRNRREAAINAAADRATGEMWARLNRSRLGQGGGPSSYDLRVGQRYLGDVGAQAALDKTAQERADYEALQSARLGLMGRRQALADTQTGRELEPYRRAQDLYGFDANALGQLGNLVHSNAIYGVQRKTTDLDRWINFLNSEQGTFNNELSTAASLAGAGGGGGGGASL